MLTDRSNHLIDGFSLTCDSRRSMFRSTRSVWCGRIRCRLLWPPRPRMGSPRSWSPGSPPPDHEDVGWPTHPNQIQTDGRPKVVGIFYLV